jgi:TonB family protein
MKALFVLRQTKWLKLLLLCLVCSPVALGQSAPEPQQPVPGFDSVEIWDSTIESLRKALWDSSQLPEPTKDSSGRGLGDYLSEFVLQPVTVQRLTELREKARAQQADPEAVKLILTEAQPIVVAELYKTFAITVYWSSQEVIEYHRKILAPWLSSADEADRQAINAHLKVTDETLRKVLMDALSLTDDAQRGAPIDRIHQVRSRATSFYNERRLDFVKLASGKAGAPAVKTYKRRSACATPAASTSGKDKPAIAPDNEAPESLYPPFAKKANVQGPVTLKAQITEFGCMESAEVSVSSGDETLDDAGLQWGERAKFLPAVKDGKAMAGTLSFRVNFELKD